MRRESISEEHLKNYIAKTEAALDKLEITAPDRSFSKKGAEDFLAMARAYFDDADHFFKNGDFVNAFACVNYAHGWLDAGARLGFFEVQSDDQLFTLYE